MARTKSSTTTRYKKTYLAQVVSRIDFAASLPIAKRGPIRHIHDSIKKEFPIVESKEGSTRSVTIDEHKTHEDTKVFTEWSYHGRDREKVVRLTKDILSVEYQRHNTYQDLRRDFLDVAKAVFDNYKDVQGQRLGLRYVNRIELDESNPTDWNKYLHPDLLGGLNLADERSTISRAFSVTEFNYGDSNLRFQYGMPNPDYPAAIRQKFFILDFDAYCNLSLTLDEISAQLDVFHARINKAFEQVITDELRKSMGFRRAK